MGDSANAPSANGSSANKNKTSSPPSSSPPASPPSSSKPSSPLPPPPSSSPPAPATSSSNSSSPSSPPSSSAPPAPSTSSSNSPSPSSPPSSAPPPQNNFPPPPPSNSPPPSPASKTPPNAPTPSSPPQPPPSTSSAPPPTTLPPSPPSSSASAPSPKSVPPPKSASPAPPSGSRPNSPPAPSRPPPPPSSSPSPPRASPPSTSQSSTKSVPPPASSNSSGSHASNSPPQHLTPNSSPKEPKAADKSSATEESVGTSTITKAVVGTVVAGAVLILFVALFFVFRRKGRKKSTSTVAYPPQSMPPNRFSPSSNKYQYGQQHQEANFSGPVNHSYGSHSQYSSSLGDFGSMKAAPDGSVMSNSMGFFTIEEVMEMTSGFDRQNIIGEGGFGCVYKGFMLDGKMVAVKQLKAGSGQGDREFKAEVEIISRVHHKHLVSLVGYSIAEDQRMLIYEFVPNKTLEHHLHGRGLPLLDWDKRLKIAIGSAKGLAYLHEDCYPKIIHRDIKSANILLDDAFEAQVADFGLARLNDTTQTHVSTRVMGTFGYLAPEYASSGKLTDRSDVFSFGVVLLELITGRKPVDPTQPLGDESLVEWARPLLVHALDTGDLSELVDPRLEKHYVEAEMFRMIETAAACVRHSAPKRPRMVQVVRALDSDGEMSDLSNGVRYGHSTAYDSGQYNQDISKFRKMAFGEMDSSEFSSGGYSLSNKSMYANAFRKNASTHR